MEVVYWGLRILLFFVLLYFVIRIAVSIALEDFYDRKILDYWERKNGDEKIDYDDFGT